MTVRPYLANRIVSCSRFAIRPRLGWSNGRLALPHTCHRMHQLPSMQPRLTSSCVHDLLSPFSHARTGGGFSFWLLGHFELGLLHTDLCCLWIRSNMSQNSEEAKLLDATFKVRQVPRTRTAGTLSPLLANLTMPAIPSINATLLSDTINDYKQQTADVLSSHAASAWNSAKHFCKPQNTFLLARPRPIPKYSL